MRFPPSPFQSDVSPFRSDLSPLVSVMSEDGIFDPFCNICRMIAEITADNTRGEYCLDVLMVAKYLERIGDHAANVAEWVEYSILGHHAD